MTNKPQFVGEKVKLGSLIKPAKVERCGKQGYPILSITKDDGIVLQSTKFKKRIASKDTASYKVVPRGKLIQGIHIDEANFAIQNLVDWGIVSPAYKIWDIDTAIVDPEYLALALRSEPSLAYYRRNLVGTVHRRGRMSNEVFYRLEVNLPSLQVQKRILVILGDAASQIAYAQQQLAHLDSLVKSRFVEMFGDPVANPKGWDVSTIKKTAITYGDGPFGSNLKSADYVPSGVRVIRLGNIMCGEFSEKDQSYVSYEKFESLRKYECTPGEVVIATLGNPILRACIVPDFGVPSIHKADCIYYETNKEMVLPVFAMCAINHLSMLQRALLDSHGQTRARINSTQAGNLPMILPPMDLQQEFAAFVSQVDKSRFIAQQQIEKLQMLYDSLAQEYFGD